MNIHEYQAKARAARIRRAGFARACRSAGRRSRRRGEEARRPGLGGEEPDPRRRPRQGQVQGSLGRRQGRRAPGQVGRRGQRVRRADARARPWSRCRPARTANRSTGSTSRKAPTSTRSSTCRSWSTGNLPSRLRVSTEGGVNIEDVAHNTPEKIVTFSVDPATGIMGASRPHRRQGAGLVRRSRQAGRKLVRSSTRRSSPRTWRCWRSTR